MLLFRPFVHLQYAILLVKTPVLSPKPRPPSRRPMTYVATATAPANIAEAAATPELDPATNLVHRSTAVAATPGRPPCPSPVLLFLHDATAAWAVAAVVAFSPVLPEPLPYLRSLLLFVTLLLLLTMLVLLLLGRDHYPKADECMCCLTFHPSLTLLLDQLVHDRFLRSDQSVFSSIALQHPSCRSRRVIPASRGVTSSASNPAIASFLRCLQSRCAAWSACSFSEMSWRFPIQVPGYTRTYFPRMR